MSRIWMLHLITPSDHLKTRQKSVQKVKCLDFRCSVFRWLLYVAASHITTVGGNLPKCIRQPQLVRAWHDLWGQTWRSCKCRDGCWTRQCQGPCTLYLKNKTFANSSSKLQWGLEYRTPQTERRLKTEPFYVPFSNGSVFEWSVWRQSFSSKKPN